MSSPGQAWPCPGAQALSTAGQRGVHVLPAVAHVQLSSWLLMEARFGSLSLRTGGKDER